MRLCEMVPLAVVVVVVAGCSCSLVDSDPHDTQAGDTTLGDATGDAATDDAATGDAATGDAATGDAATGNAATGDAATGDAATGDAATGDAATGDAATGDAATGDAATGDAATGDSGGTNGEIVFIGDFEPPGNFEYGGTYSQFSPNVDTCEHDEMCDTDSFEIVADPVRGGSRSLRITLREGDEQQTSGTRAELQTQTHYDHAIDEDFWYGWSIFIPNEWVFDPDNKMTFHQWHTGPGQPGTSPIIGLRIRGSRWYITRELWDDNTSVTLWQDDQDVARGVWTDWVMHVRWSTGDNGAFTVWQNGIEVYSDTGPNLAAGTSEGNHYQKFGLYGVFGDIVDELVCYYDEVKVATGPDAYFLVAP